MSQDDASSQRVSEITRENVRTVKELEQLAVANPSFADRTASFVARFCGSIHFVWVHAVVFGGWIAVNAFPGLPHWDPYPFTFLTMWASMESIFIAAFILISQNYAMRLSERRAQLDLQVNLLAEQEATKTLRMLDAIAKQVGAQVGNDPEVEALAQATKLDSLARQIDETQRDEEHAEDAAH